MTEFHCLAATEELTPCSSALRFTVGWEKNEGLSRAFTLIIPSHDAQEEHQATSPYRWQGTRALNHPRQTKTILIASSRMENPTKNHVFLFYYR